MFLVCCSVSVCTLLLSPRRALHRSVAQCESQRAPARHHCHRSHHTLGHAYAIACCEGYHMHVVHVYHLTHIEIVYTCVLLYV